MKNPAVSKHLKDASYDISTMIGMVGKKIDCVEIIKKSKEARSKIQTARTLMVKQCLKNCATDLFKRDKQEKLTEIMRINKYR